MTQTLAIIGLLAACCLLLWLNERTRRARDAAQTEIVELIKQLTAASIEAQQPWQDGYARGTDEGRQRGRGEMFEAALFAIAHGADVLETLRKIARPETTPAPEELEVV